ncbi:UpxY family transcription antiterminator [uncultured Parabacteroides sp.]|jgi:transcription antitermination factor NusG|uniref:UpxY family transcription antiterminator n=1 Tax=uncultured Parabacteroides sp. TaxID=512312 RepID=UPI0025EB1262|nr:UpxY family transcription antiterminator [uncultured Parabacteroides sp.]
MNIDEPASNANTKGGINPPCTGLTPDALPEVQKPSLVENSHTGVSTRNALSANKVVTFKKAKQTPHWYALRATYGREKKAYEYIITNGGTAFYPTRTTVKNVDGKRKTIEESYLPNILFAYGTEGELNKFVYNNEKLSYLRYYYRHFHVGNKIAKEPLIVSDDQLESLRIICKAEAGDIVVSTDEVEKFQKGQTVRIIDGKFKGVVGTVARYQGQQRVGIIIDGLLTIATAYIPSAFLSRMIPNSN